MKILANTAIAIMLFAVTSPISKPMSEDMMNWVLGPTTYVNQNSGSFSAGSGTFNFPRGLVIETVPESIKKDLRQGYTFNDFAKGKNPKGRVGQAGVFDLGPSTLV